MRHQQKLAMTKNTDRFFVITGGPGSGKSTLIDALQQRGYERSVEAGRGIIQNQLAIGGRALPWIDPSLFAELMLCWEMRSYRMAENCRGVVFFDRGVPDVLGYLRLVGRPAPEYMTTATAAFRYNRRVFIAPPWEEIFQQDRERKQDFKEAIRTYEVMRSVYNDCGYELIEIPRASVEERVWFVLRSIEDFR
jgi:predicted ATPase